MVVICQDRIFKKSNGKLRRGFYLDDTLKFNLDNFLIRGVKNNHDGIGLITGLEGSGKSTFAQALAYYVDPSFNVNRVVFTGNDLMKCIDTASVGQAIIFDEAIMDMASQDFATDMQKILIKKFTLIRKKRLYIFLVIPSIYMLRKYFAIFRTRYMINCYCPDGIARGYFRFYSFNTKKKLFLLGFKEMNMGAVKFDFRGTFTDTYGFFIDAVEYERRKDEAIRRLTEEDRTPKQKLQEAFEDYKLKLKLDVESFKTKYREKCNAQKQKFVEQFGKYKLVQKSKFDGLRDEVVELQKNKIAKQYYSVLFFCYFYLKNLYVDYAWDKQFDEECFLNLLKSYRFNLCNLNQLKSDLAKGEELLKLKKL